MNAPVLAYSLEPFKAHAFNELDSVRLRHPVETDDGEKVPEGTQGVVVGIWADGAAYEVEFPFGLATVEVGFLASVEP